MKHNVYRVILLFYTVFSLHAKGKVKTLERLSITANANLYHVNKFSLYLSFIISTHKLVVLRNFSSIRIVLSCFYLLIFDVKKFSN